MMFMSAFIPCTSPANSQTPPNPKLFGSGSQNKLLSPATFPLGLYGAGSGDLLPPHHHLMVPEMFYPLPLHPSFYPQIHRAPSATKEGESKQGQEKLNFGIDKILEKTQEKEKKPDTDQDLGKDHKGSSSGDKEPKTKVLPPTFLPPQFSLPYNHPALANPFNPFTAPTHSIHSVYEQQQQHNHGESSSRSQCPAKRKRSWSRAVFSALQRKGLEKRFEVQKYVTKPDRRQLAAVLGLTDAQVKVWFQNRRMKWRHMEEQRKKQQLAQSRQVTQQSKPPAMKCEPQEGHTLQEITEVHVHVTDSELESDTEC